MKIIIVVLLFFFISSVSHLISDRKVKSTRYGNCQKSKGNVF